MAVYVLTYEAKVPLENAVAKLHHMARDTLRVEWQNAFYWWAKKARVPPLGLTTVESLIERPDRRAMPDPGAGCTATKWAIDALPLAGVWPDDSPDYVKSITYSVAVTGRHALTLTLTGEPTDG